MGAASPAVHIEGQPGTRATRSAVGSKEASRHRSFARAFTICALAVAATAPALAANDLTGTSVGVNWFFPDLSTNFAAQTVTVGAGPEIQCAGGEAGSNLCTGLTDAASIDIGAQTLALTIDSGTAIWAGATFNGYEFSNLSAGGAWAGYSLATTFSGLDASRISFTPDAVFINMQGIAPAAGESFTITLTSAVPEPASPALLIAGFGVIACIARRRRA